MRIWSVRVFSSVGIAIGAVTVFFILTFPEIEMGFEWENSYPTIPSLRGTKCGQNVIFWFQTDQLPKCERRATPHDVLIPKSLSCRKQVGQTFRCKSASRSDTISKMPEGCLCVLFGSFRP